MDAEEPEPDSGDEEFLDRAFERAVALLEQGSVPSAGELLGGREHLRAEIERLLLTARQVTPIRGDALPSVRGFTLLEELGRGGMGAVFLAQQHTLGGRRVALKVLPAGAGLSARARERFLAEARTIASLRHSNVVTIHDVVAEDGVHAYAMEFVDGLSLGKLIEALKARRGGKEDRDPQSPGPDMAVVRELLGAAPSAGPTYPLFVCGIGIAIARALAALHQAGLVHRDVKPANILLRRDGTPLLSDFGLVHESDADLTHGGEFVGTLAYASPEQIGGDPESLDARSDVYALGVTLYQALTLQLPFDDRRGGLRRASTPAGMLRLIEPDRAAPLRAWNRRLPRDLETILAKALEPDLARRYASATDFADDLERLLSLQPIHARPAGWLARGLKLVRRNRAAAIGIGAGSLASLALAAAAVVYVFIVPRWVEEHVREARLALLDPSLANAMFIAEFFGMPEEVPATRYISDAVLDRALGSYAAALRWKLIDADIRAERDVIRAVRLGTEAMPALDPPERGDLRSAGLCAYLNGDITAAVRHWEVFELERSVTAPTDPLVEAGLGILYLVREEPARAYPRLRVACQSFPDVAFLTTYLADAAVRCGDLDAAERLLLAAQGMERPDPLGAGERVLADLRAAQGRTAEAEALYGSIRRASPGGLHHARFLDALGRREESLDLYMLVAANSRAARVTQECAVAVERWWMALPPAERLHRILAALDQDPLDPRYLIARLRVVAEASPDFDQAPLQGSAKSSPTGEAKLQGVFAALSTLASSPSIENRSPVELARTLEVTDMTRWSSIHRYPRPFQALQFLAWSSPWPAQLSRAVSTLDASFVRLQRIMTRSGVLIALAGASQAQNCPEAPCFQGLGDLPGGIAFSEGRNLSSDGTTVVGYSTSAASSPGLFEPFRWRMETGMVPLGDLPGHFHMGLALGVTADGSTVTGYSSSGLGTLDLYRFPEAFVWTQAGGMVGLGDVPGGHFFSWAHGISDDGSVIFGAASSGSVDGVAATWSSSTGWVIRDPGTAGSIFTSPSRSGYWAVGNTGTPPLQALRWSEALGLEVLGTPPGGSGGLEAVVDDGTAAVGGFRVGGVDEAYLWTPAGFQALGVLPGGGGTFSSQAWSILRDGTLIVGVATSALGQEAVLWDEARTLHRVVDVLASFDVVVPAGWTLRTAFDIVQNGNVVTVCGSGTNPSGATEAWIARYLACGAPVAYAGADQSVAEGSIVHLDGTPSSIPCGEATYTWTQVAGLPVTLDLSDAARPVFTTPFVPVGGETLTFQLVVNDGRPRFSTPDVVNVTVTNVNHPPVAMAGDDQTLAEASPVMLDGSNSFDEDDDALSYTWTQLGGPFAALDLTNPIQPTFTAPLVGVAGDALVFQLTVSDTSASATDSVTVFVDNVNHLPTADAGPDQTRGEGVLVTLDASASQDPDGDTLSFAWSQIGGPVVVLANGNTDTPSFTAPQVGALGALLAFRVNVGDGYGGTAFDDVEVTVQDLNSPPFCDLARPSVSEIWPPNHKLVTVSILGVTDPENNAITIRVLGVTQDEPINGLGDGDTGPDAVIQGNTLLLRAERSGTGNGRVYRVTFEADDGNGGVCSGQVKVCVPHSKSKNAPPPVDDGQVHDSLGS